MNYDVPDEQAHGDTHWMRRLIRDIQDKMRDGATAYEDICVHTIKVLRSRVRAVEAARNTKARSKEKRALALCGLDVAITRRIHTAMEIAARHFKVPVQAMLGKSRVSVIARPRHVALWAVRKTFVGTTLTDIAIASNRDHSTVIHAVNTVDNRRYLDAHYRQMTDVILAEVGAFALTEESGRVA